jgi:hypothetical protein
MTAGGPRQADRRSWRPKYTAGPHPTDLIDKWALFFRDAENLDVIPPELDEEPFREAFEIARIAALSDAEYELYERYRMQEMDDRGMLVKAREEGYAEGQEEHRQEQEEYRQKQEARVAAERRAEEEAEARRQEAEAREAAAAQLREAMPRSNASRARPRTVERLASGPR